MRLRKSTVAEQLRLEITHSLTLGSSDWCLSLVLIFSYAQAHTRGQEQESAISIFKELALSSAIPYGGGTADLSGIWECPFRG
jgi:hypothetical protein